MWQRRDTRSKTYVIVFITMNVKTFIVTYVGMYIRMNVTTFIMTYVMMIVITFMSKFM